MSDWRSQYPQRCISTVHSPALSSVLETHNYWAARLLAYAIGLATGEMDCACIIGSGIKRAANPFGSVCEPSRSILTSYWTWCCTGKVTRASVEREVWL